MFTYFHTDFLPYFFHTLSCPLHWVAPVVVASSLIFYRKKRGKSLTTWRFSLLLSSLFVVSYLMDVPAVFARCPASSPTSPSVGFSGGDLAGVILGVTAGLITFLSPCGLPPLPAYIRYFLGARTSKERAVSLSFLATSGFVFSLAVFTIAFLQLRGLLYSPIYNVGIPKIPVRRGVPPGSYVFLAPNAFDFLGYAAGIIAVALGLLMLFGVRIPLPGPRTIGKFDRSVRSVFLFSLAWGLASIACSPYAIVPLLLFAVAKGGVAPFLGFGLGMALPVLSISLLLGLGRGPMVERLIRTSTKLHRYSALLLVVTGVGIIVYTFLYPTGTSYYRFV